MCGVAGYAGSGLLPPDADRLERMLAPIRGRGPDGEGVCLIAGAEGRVRSYRTDRSPVACAALPHLRDSTAAFTHDVALAHTRYAIMDRSDDSHQPWVAPGDDVVVAFQGEIYNYLELRDELAARGHDFRTASDTEVLCLAYREWGDDAWPRLNGFWAAAVYDARNRRLVLCRDRLGIAPLYLSRTEDALLFGSSPLALAAQRPGGARPRWPRVRDFVETGLRDFDERTLLDGVEALAPGTLRRIDFRGAEPLPAPAERYWALPAERLTERDLSLDEAARRVRDTLAGAVELRLRADRPVAFQLSGGLDSTSVIAAASLVRPGPLPTFTVSVPEEDEEPYAATMARRFRLERTVLADLERGMLDDPPSLARLLAEPVQAPSALAHHLMCRRMKEAGFGVTLSGSGGDEALAGYEWDFWPAAKRVLRADGHRLQAMAYQLALEAGSPGRAVASARRRLGRLVRGGRAVRAGADGPEPAAHGATHDAPGAGAARACLARFETLGYDARRAHHLRVAHLPYYLASNDRATLGIPLEHRQPFLDHRLVELGLRLPPSYLFRRGWTKYVLRRAMAGVLPREIVWRRDKVGFPFPLGRLVARDRPVLEAAYARWAREPHADAADVSFEALLASDPRRLWRSCSVGLWLDVLG